MHCRACMLVSVLVLGINLLLVAPQVDAARQTNVESWVSQTVTPFVAEQLATHPRFKGELIRFIVFIDGNPAPMSNSLALALRDRLAAAVADVPGVRVALPSMSSEAAIDCTLDDAHYFIGLEISALGDGEYRADLRALDREDRTWVAGFAKSWRGTMSRPQLRALRQAQVDTYFQGERSAPFPTSQPDLLAAEIAHELGCALLRQVAGEYVVLLDDKSESSTPLNGVVELVSNNLAGHQVLQLTEDPKRANAVLRGKAHSVDGVLHQYWVTVTPLNTASDLPTLSSSAYVQFAAKQFHPNIVPPGNEDVLSSIRIVEVSGRRACDFDADNCFAMQVRTNKDAVVFFLNHQRNHGLVRLSGRDCAARTEARIARADEALNQPLPLHTLMHNAATTADSWLLNPEADTYYAIAVSDTKAARVLSKHLQKLPQRCTDAVRFGLEGARLESWLTDLSAALAAWQPHVDWQAIHVKNVF